MAGTVTVRTFADAFVHEVKNQAKLCRIRSVGDAPESIAQEPADEPSGMIADNLEAEQDLGA